MATTTISVPLIRTSANHRTVVPVPFLALPLRNLHLRTHAVSNSFNHFTFEKKNTKTTNMKQPLIIVRSAEEETVPIPEEQPEAQQQEEEGEAPSSSSEQPPVSVPVSPSDTLIMFFQAEGTLSETAIPNVTKALEEAEGITSLKVQVVEGIASVELTKQTTVQATGVASSLVETIQGSGFKLQTLNLSFEDEEYSLA